MDAMYIDIDTNGVSLSFRFRSFREIVSLKVKKMLKNMLFFIKYIIVLANVNNKVLRIIRNYCNKLL